MKNPSANPPAGFTFIEILIVVAITAMISAFAVVYSRQGERQISLYVEEQKVVAFIERARSLAVTIYGSGSSNSQPLCGYGFEVNYSASPTYSLFGYGRPSGSNSPTVCETIGSIDPSLIMTDSKSIPRNYVNVPFDPNVKPDGTQSDALQYVVFIAPAPRTIVSTVSGGGNGSGSVHLQTQDGISSVAVTVSPSGEVDF